MSGSLTERGWFSQRYAFPGFIFILLIFLINLDLVINVLAGSNSNIYEGVIVSILTLFSGPAIGFLVTQGWYSLFNFDFSLNDNKCYSKCISFRKFYWKKYYDNLIRRKIAKERSFIEDGDYWLHAIFLKKNSTINKESVYIYLTRRWDLFQLLWSVVFTIIVSLLAGYILRFLLPHMFLIPISSLQKGILSRFYHKLLIAVSLCIVGIIIFGARRIQREHLSALNNLFEWDRFYYR